MPSYIAGHGAGSVSSWEESQDLVMGPKYDISYDPESGILTVSLTGYLPPGEIPKYLAARATGREEARRRAGRLRMLVNAGSAAVQSTEMAARVQSDWADAIRSPSDKIAIVPSSALHAMQIRRTISSDQVRVFTSITEAQQWLLSA